MVRRLVADGATVLLTTQYLEEANQLADGITVFDQGRVVAEGRPDELKRRVGGQTLQVRPTVLADLDQVGLILADLTGATPVHDANTGLLAMPVADPMLVSALVRRPDGAGIAADELGLRLPSPDEVFLALTGHGTTPTTPSDEAARTNPTPLPVSLTAGALRGLLNGGEVAGPLLGSLGWMAGVVAVFFPLALRAYRRHAA